MVVPLNNTYISLINAFRSDCDDLLKKFKVQCSEDFRDFVPLWKSLKFNLIYEKYSNNYNMNYDFKEDTLQIAKLIMLGDNFVGGMFLLYGLYYIQEDPKPCIRLDHSEFKKILQQVRVQRTTSMESCQPGYLFAKLLKNDAFAFVRFSREFSMERLDRVRIIFNGQPTLSTREERQVKPKEWLNEFLGKIDIVEDLKKAEQDYQSKTHKLKEEHPELGLSLDMLPDDLIEGLQETLTQANTKFIKPPTIGEKRKRIRNRKMVTKRRNDIPSTSKQDESCLPAQAKKKGGPTGKHKLYYKVMVNEPDSEKSSESDSNPDEPKFSLPNID